MVLEILIVGVGMVLVWMDAGSSLFVDTDIVDGEYSTEPLDSLTKIVEIYV